ERERRKDRLTERGMPSDDLALLLGEVTRGLEHLSVDAELTDVAQQGRDVEGAPGAATAREGRGDRDRCARHAFTRSGEHRLVALDREAEGVHDPRARLAFTPDRRTPGVRD